MAPVGELHRTRGRFGNEAAATVFAVPGPAARLAPVIAGAITFLLIGLLLGSLRPGRASNGAMRRTVRAWPR
jgi:hypothetical protein